MSQLSELSLRTFLAGRSGWASLRDSPLLPSFAEVPRIRFASGIGTNARLARGAPRPVECSWDGFCDSVKRYSQVVVGPRPQDKAQHSAWVIAGELLGSSGMVGSSGKGLNAVAGGPPRSSRVQRIGRVERGDAAVNRITMLVLDCDQPAPIVGLVRTLRDLQMAFCLAPTWSWTVDRPKWRLFVPVGPLTADQSAEGLVMARLRYAWLAGLFSEMGGLPRECGVCHGKVGGARLSGHACPACAGSGSFTLDLSCWNYSRLHFLGGLRQAEDANALGREVVSGAGVALDVEAWLEGSGWPEWLSAQAGGDAQGGFTKDGSGAGSALHMAYSGDVDEDVAGSAHPDPELSAAMQSCRVPLWERVRRAVAYVGSPSFPPSISGARGHDALMRACSVVCSGFLVPCSGSVGVGDEGWADLVLLSSFNPRCSPPWSEGEVRRKVRQVRLGGGRVPGGMLNALGSDSVDEAKRFFLVPDSRRGSIWRVVSDRGADQSVASDELTELLADAALACPIDPYDPREIPESVQRVLASRVRP